MIRNLLTPVTVLLILATLGTWVHYRFFYTGTRRKPIHKPQHSAAPGRTPLVWIDWEGRHGRRIMQFGAAL